MKNYPEISKLVYATDLGRQTRPVFRHALAMAKQYDAKIIMLHVVEPMSESAKSVINSYLPSEFTEDMQKETMGKLLAKMKSRLEVFYADECENNVEKSLVTGILVVAGKPSEEILRVVEEEKADMIVMGKSTRKVRGIRVMGSSARRVSRISNVPVLIVPNY